MLRLLARFSLAGVANTLVGYAVIVACVLAGASDYLTNAIGYGVGLIVSFTLNRQYVFGVRGAVSRVEVTRFLAAFALAYAVNVAVLWATRMIVGEGNPLAQLPAIVAYAGVFFLLSHRFVFAGATRK